MKSDQYSDSITSDDERFFIIATQAITKMDSELQESNQQFAIEIIKQMAYSMQDNTTLSVMLRVKSLIDEMIKNTCKGVYMTICDRHINDHDYCLRLMIELIIIIIRRYGGSISPKMLEKLLGNCDGYQQAIVYLIDSDIIRCVKQNDGSPACFYIPNDSNSN